MKSPPDSQSEDWSTVLDAVKAYVSTTKTTLPDPVKTFVIDNRNSFNDKSGSSAADLADVADIESFPSDVIALDKETLERVRCTSDELSSVLHHLKHDFPLLLSEAVLLAEEERAIRELATAELEVIRDKWKSDVDKLNEVIHQKDESIKFTQNLVYSSSQPKDDQSITVRKLAEAEAEIRSLRELIASNHSVR